MIFFSYNFWEIETQVGKKSQSCIIIVQRNGRENKTCNQERDITEYQWKQSLNGLPRDLPKVGKEKAQSTRQLTTFKKKQQQRYQKEGFMFWEESKDTKL